MKFGETRISKSTTKGGGEDAFNEMCLMASNFSRIDCVSKQLKITDAKVRTVM